MKHQTIKGNATTIVAVCDAGDEAVSVLRDIARLQKITAARITAIGAFSKATVAFFDLSIKDYVKIPVNEQVEVLSLIGDISVYEGKPKIHVHVTLGRPDGSTIGGHLMEGTVNPTLEIIIDQIPITIERRLDQKTGLPLIHI